MSNVVEFIYKLQDRVSGTLQKLEKNSQRVQEQMERTEKKVSTLEGSLTRVAARYLSFTAAIMGGKAFLNLGMNMEQTRAKFEVMLGSVEKGNKMIADINQMANITPFNNADLVKSSEVLLAYNYDAQKLLPTLEMLGNVAMGDRGKLAGLTLAFGQMSSTGRLLGQDLLQMINQGFNPLVVISEKTGKSMAVLKKEMEAGLISSEMVEEAFRLATSEGGRFYNMMDKMSQTGAGKLSTFIGALQLKLTELAEKLNPFIVKIMDFGIKIVNNFERIAKTIWAALLPVRAFLNGVATLFQYFKENKTLLVFTTIALVAYKLAAWQALLATKGLSIGAVLASKAFGVLNAVLLKNPFTAVLVGITLLVGALVMLRKKSKEAADGLDEINRKAATYSSDEKARLDMIFSKLRQTNPKTKERNELVKQLQEMYPDVLKNMNLEKAGLEELATAYDSIVLSINNKARARAYEDQLVELHKEKDIAEKEGKEQIEWIQAMLNKGVGEKTLRMQPVKVKYGGKSFSGSDAFDKLDNLRRINAEIASILGAAKKNYKDDPLKRVAGGGNGDPSTQTDTSISGLTGAGSRPTNITINLRNLIEYLNMYPQTVREGVDNMENQLIEGLLRVVNSANRIAAR